MNGKTSLAAALVAACLLSSAFLTPGAGAASVEGTCTQTLALASAATPNRANLNLVEAGITAACKPPTPDLCDDRDDSFKKVYEVTPTKDTIMVVGPGDLATGTGAQSAQEEGSEPTVDTMLTETGTTKYHAEIWKCSDTDWVDEVRYYGYKSGYNGNGAAWQYDDYWSDDKVECYYAPAVDAGQILCEAWANSPPLYTTSTAWLYLGPGIGTGAVAYGVANWDTLTSPITGGLAWNGEFDGIAGGTVPAPVSAEFLAYL